MKYKEYKAENGKVVSNKAIEAVMPPLLSLHKKGDPAFKELRKKAENSEYQIPDAPLQTLQKLLLVGNDGSLAPDVANIAMLAIPLSDSFLLVAPEVWIKHGIGEPFSNL